MSELRDIAQFHSTRFSPILPEEAQVNPEVYGAELAYWLCTELVQYGVVTSYPGAEDWGWYIEYITPAGAEFVVHCYNVEGARDEWFLALRRHGRKMFGRDKPPYQDAAPLIEGIKKLLVSSIGADVKWLYDATPGP